MRLEAYRRYWTACPIARARRCFYLSYFPVTGEAGPEMPYDFSLASAQNRWSAGRLDMEEGLARMANPRASDDFVTVIRRPDPEQAPAPATAPKKVAA